MEKTINCAECHKDYTYNEREGFPRKYCGVCSEVKKASFKAASESKPTHTSQGVPLPVAVVSPNGELGTIEHVPVEKIPDQTVSFSSEENGQIGLEYEIRSREVKCRALASTIEYQKLFPQATFLDILEQFEKYILGEE